MRWWMPLLAAVSASAWALAETKPPRPPVVQAAELPISVEQSVSPPTSAAPVVPARMVKTKLRTPLPRVARVSGQAVDADGRGVATTLSFEGNAHVMIVAESDDHGGFAVELPPGTYHLHASDGEGEDDLQLAVVADEERNDLLVALSAPETPSEAPAHETTVPDEDGPSMHCTCDQVNGCSCVPAVVVF